MKSVKTRERFKEAKYYISSFGLWCDIQFKKKKPRTCIAKGSVLERNTNSALDGILWEESCGNSRFNMVNTRRALKLEQCQIVKGKKATAVSISQQQQSAAIEVSQFYFSSDAFIFCQFIIIFKQIFKIILSLKKFIFLQIITKSFLQKFFIQLGLNVCGT